MTARQMLEALLIESDKVNAPSLLLEDYNYFINKAINQYINKSYNLYDINQQYSDNLRVLKATQVLQPVESQDDNQDDNQNDNQKSYSASYSLGKFYEFNLPGDYLHMLNCICVFKVQEGKRLKCYNSGDYIPFAAKRLTSDSWSQILHNYYNRPSYKNPYYYIHNVNDSEDGSLPTNSKDVTYKKISEEPVKYEIDNEIPNILTIGANASASVIEKDGGIRYGNPPSPSVRCEIRCGDLRDGTLALQEIHIDYLKAPQHIRLTQEQMDQVADTSQVLEFPDYVCQEIINELVHIVMEQNSDPRLQTHIPVSQSIANPAQQQAQ